MILCAQTEKISKTVLLKVEEKLHEITVIEEEWRLDPDWWLQKDDRSSPPETQSEYSSSQHQDEDLELINSEIGGEEVDSIDEELSTDAGNLNLQVNVGDGGYGIECQRDCARDGVIGPNRAVGTNKVVGLGADAGSDYNGQKDWVCGTKGNEVNDSNEKGIHSDRIMEVQNKRWRNLEECYSPSLPKIFAEKTLWITGRTKQRQGQRKMVQQIAEATSKWVGSISLSDGCIEHRNQVIKRDLSLFEVRRMISVGKRLGINFQGNEEEVESRLLEGEGRTEVQGRCL
ncbi:hypothetical protein SLA2020_316080 [Shorea laevis]